MAKGESGELPFVRTRAEINSVALQMEMRPFNFDTQQKFPEALDLILQHSRGIVIVTRPRFWSRLFVPVSQALGATPTASALNE